MTHRRATQWLMISDTKTGSGGRAAANLGLSGGKGWVAVWIVRRGGCRIGGGSGAAGIRVVVDRGC